MFESLARESLHSDVFWEVQFVFDPDALTDNFAYTVGLAQRGYPELHLRAAPSQEVSESPWVLSAKDCGMQLNSFARKLIEGTLEVGKPFTSTYDGGATTIIWTPGEPTDRRDVDAHRVDAASLVIPMHSELVSTPIMPLADLSDREEARWRFELEQIVGNVTPNRRGLRGFRAPRPDASYSCHQDFGPLTPLVEARAYALAQATPEMLADLVERCLDTDRCFGSGAVLGTAHTHARLVSRQSAAWNAGDLATTLVHSFRGPEGGAPMWRALLALTGVAHDGGNPHSGLSGVLTTAFAAILVATTVTDRLDEETRSAAFGPWSSARTASSMSPDPAWWAPDHVLDRISAELDDLDWQGVDALAVAWQQLSEDPFVMLLRGLAVTGPRGCPSASELLGGSLGGVRAAFTPDLEWTLTEFLCCATALLAERAKFDAAHVHRFCLPFASVLPNLETAMNSPL
ncbi:hypothetical protein [Antrihabitans sp. YC2-6]|uniref:hypothetical protein n=1 Tax=Antrihabitans sp. YC2-6 TaxID=2799498 RepID=UPI0018F765A8|nr:hypothetical protein [Antrihabitans sp. YC2-6]MBJ8348073.1 hypothetical protein [Antrihabitans sp. YC2-6]